MVQIRLLLFCSQGLPHPSEYEALECETKITLGCKLKENNIRYFKFYV